MALQTPSTTSNTPAGQASTQAPHPTQSALIVSLFPLASYTVDTDKGANITLEEGVEAFCFSRDLVKEDGKQAVAGETLPFKVIELRRSTRRILVSHTRTYAEAKEAKAAAEIDTTKKAVKKINSTIEKTTLGDISELAALKNKLEKGE